ncbi:MAG: hypothetical protein IJH60_05910, partial [Eubacterium sp.]|nr:hypothetical protein [Eubacterium sp.]
TLVAHEKVDALGHNWGEGEVTKEPTCTEAGVRKYTCKTCKTTRAEEIEATGHTVAILEAVTPTCTEEGKTEGQKCSVCGKILVAQEKVDALGHKWDKGKVTTEPKCTEKGVKTYTCEVCKETRTEEIEATGHTVAILEAVAPTCTEDGKTEGKRCTVCGEILEEQEVIKATGHKWDEGTVTTEPKCTEDGLKTYICEICKATKEEIVEATGHKEEIIPAVAATCVEDGLTAGVKCSVCGAILEAQEISPAKGHTEVIMKAVDPTCTESGLTAGIECSVCGEILKAQETIEATGHKWDRGTVTRKPTCTEDGMVTYTCKECKTTKEEVAEATGHSWDEGTVTIEPTPTEDGLMTYRCTSCGATKEETIKATGHVHAWEDGYTIDIAPTETSEGSKSIHCSICNEIKPGSSIPIDRLKPVKPEPGNKDDEHKQRFDDNDSSSYANNTGRKGIDGTPVGEGASIDVAEKAILTVTSDEGPAGTKYAPLKLRSTKQSKKSITLKWNRVKGANKYIIYGNRCGSKNKLKKIATTTGKTKTLKKVAGKKIKKG